MQSLVVDPGQERLHRDRAESASKPAPGAAIGERLSELGDRVRELQDGRITDAATIFQPRRFALELKDGDAISFSEDGCRSEKTDQGDFA